MGESSVSQNRDNSGILGKNERREKDTHPTHSGQCTIEGKQYWISAWVKDGRGGSRFFSLAFKPKMAREQGAPANPPAQTAAAKDEFDDSIPF
jgi:hypothetical protein